MTKKVSLPGVTCSWRRLQAELPSRVSHWQPCSGRTGLRTGAWGPSSSDPCARASLVPGKGVSSHFFLQVVLVEGF